MKFLRVDAPRFVVGARGLSPFRDIGMHAFEGTLAASSRPIKSPLKPKNGLSSEDGEIRYIPPATIFPTLLHLDRLYIMHHTRNY